MANQTLSHSPKTRERKFSFLDLWAPGYVKRTYHGLGVVFPTRGRAIGVGFASAIGRHGSILGPNIVGVILPVSGQSGVFALGAISFAIAALVSLFTCLFSSVLGAKIKCFEFLLQTRKTVILVFDKQQQYCNTYQIVQVTCMDRLSHSSKNMTQMESSRRKVYRLGIMGGPINIKRPTTKRLAGIVGKP